MPINTLLCKLFVAHFITLNISHLRIYCNVVFKVTISICAFKYVIFPLVSIYTKCK